MWSRIFVDSETFEQQKKFLVFGFKAKPDDDTKSRERILIMERSESSEMFWEFLKGCSVD